MIKHRLFIDKSSEYNIVSSSVEEEKKCVIGISIIYLNNILF